MNRKIKQGYRVISAVLIFVLCVNTLFTASISTHAAETDPGIETNAIHTYNNSSVTEGVIYETAPESGKVWGNSPLIESAQPKTMAAPMSAPSGVVKPSDNANDSSSHDGMYADTGSNHIDGIGGHYEYQDVWVVDRVEILKKTTPAVYKEVLDYIIPAHTEQRTETVPGYTEIVNVPRQVFPKKEWIPEKVTYVPTYIPSKTAYRTVTKPGYWIYGTKTIPGYWKYGSKLIPGKTVRTKVKIGGRYVWKTTKIPPRTVKTKTWVAPRTVPNNHWVPTKQVREPYTIPGHMENKRVVKPGYFRDYEVVIDAHKEYIYHKPSQKIVTVDVPPKEVYKSVLVSPEKVTTEEREIGHFKKVKVWVADPVSTGGNSGSSGDSGSDSSDETDTDDTEEDTASSGNKVHGMKAYFDSVVFPEVPQIEGFSRKYVGSTLQWVYTGSRDTATTQAMMDLIKRINENGGMIDYYQMSDTDKKLMQQLLDTDEDGILLALEAKKIEFLMDATGLINQIETPFVEELLRREREKLDAAITQTIHELEKMEEMRVLGMKMLGEIRAYMNKAENGTYYQVYQDAMKEYTNGSGLGMMYGMDPNKAWDDDKTASSGTLYSRYVENSSKLVKITGILEGLKDMNASQMSLEEYMNYMGPIWELNQKYRGAIDELEDLQFCVQVLGILFAGMGMIQALTSTAIIDTVLDVVDAGISFVLGDYAGFAIGGISILLPEIFESGLKTAKKTLQSGDDILEVLSKKEKQALLDKLDEAGITNVTKVEMGSDGVKIHSASGVIDAKWTDEIVEGASELISEVDRLKINSWTYRPSDDLYVRYKHVYDNPTYYDQVTGSVHWPANDGFLDGTMKNISVDKNVVFKRYGESTGEFLGNATDSFESRALAPQSEGANQYFYRPTEQFEITSGKAAPWFGSDGGADQFVKYKPDGSRYSIDELMDLGLLEDITDKVKSGEVIIN